MQVDHQWRDDFVISTLVGELDTPTTDEVWTQLLEVIDFAPRGVVLDLSRCSYIASVGISLMVRLAKELRAINTPLRIANVSPNLRLVLETVNLPALIPIDRTVDNALTRLALITHHPQTT